MFGRGYVSSNLQVANETDTMGPGSENILVAGAGITRIFKGLAQRIGSPNPIGSRLLMNIADAYGGLGNVTQSAIGSIFRVLGAVFFIGSGRLYFNGADTLEDASSTLSLKLVTSGALSGTTYQAGLPQSSAPTISAITPTASLTGKNDGTVSVQLVRVRSATGARSIASPTSNIVACKNQSVLLDLSDVAASPNGQDYWEVYVTLNGYGGVGNHYYLTEFKESDISQTTSATATGVSTTTFTVPDAALSPSNVGWQVSGSQWESITVVTTGVVGAGNMRTVVTSTSSTLATIDFAVSASATASQIADALRDALNGNGSVDDLFIAYSSGPTVYLKKLSGIDSTMNFSLVDAPTTPATNITNVPSSTGGKIFTWITAVGDAGSGGGTTRLVTVDGNIQLAPGQTDAFTFTQATEGAARTYALEWRDSDLAGADLAPIYDYPPPAGLFGGVLGDVTFVDGCLGDDVDVNASTATDPALYPGNAIAVSEPMRPESFSPTSYIFTNDTPIALIEGSQGVYWRFGRNSLGVLRYTGGSPAISYERLWTGAGINNQNNVTLAAGGRLYAYTGARGAVRTGNQGELDTSFAAAVSNDMVNWNPANVVLGYDANTQYVFYAHNQTILAYYEPLNMWCAPLNVAESLGDRQILAMVTFNSEVYISAGYARAFNIGGFNTSTDLFTATGHMFANKDVVRLYSTGTLPTGFVADMDYWVVSAGSNVFGLASSPGGALLPLTDAGTGTVTAIGGSAALYAFNAGSGTTGKLVTQWQMSPLEFDILSRVKMTILSDSVTTNNVKTYINGLDTPKLSQTVQLRAGLQVPTTIRPNVRNARIWKLESSMTSTGGNAGWENITVEGETSGITI